MGELAKLPITSESVRREILRFASGIESDHHAFGRAKPVIFDNGNR